MPRGCLVANKAEWIVPSYARKMLWVRQGDTVVQANGPQGTFSIETTPHDLMFLHWGNDEGIPLFAWNPPGPDAPCLAHWHGTVSVGGFVERLHILDARGVDMVAAEVVGGLLPLNYRRLPTLADMQDKAYSRQNDNDTPLTATSSYVLLTLADSAFAEHLHLALVSELPVDVFATLAPQEGRWHEIAGLPLLLDSMTVLAPGYRAITPSQTRL